MCKRAEQSDRGETQSCFHTSLMLETQKLQKTDDVFIFLIYKEQEMCLVIQFVKFIASVPHQRKGILYFYKDLLGFLFPFLIPALKMLDPIIEPLYHTGPIIFSHSIHLASQLGNLSNTS